MRRTYEPLPLSPLTLARIERVAEATCGRRGERALVAAVRALSQLYTRERGRMQPVDATPDALLARLRFFLVRDLPKVFGPLDELARVGLPARRETLRVLDVGAGLGATSLGLARWLRLRGHPARSLEVVALERSEPALRAFGALARALSEQPDELAPIHLEPRCGDLRSVRREGRFDLVLFGFVINELFTELSPEERVARRAEILVEAASQLAEDGAVIVLEPALKESARALMQVRDVIAAAQEGPSVLAPCLHTHGCPMLRSERDWCHQELPYALPGSLASVARAAGLRFEGLSFASLVLTKARHGREGSLHRVVSDRLESKGKLELFTCSEAGYVRLTRLTRDASEANRAFGEAQRGAVLRVEAESPRIAADTEVRRG